MKLVGKSNLKAAPARVDFGIVPWGDEVITSIHLVNYGIEISSSYPVVMINTEPHVTVGAVTVDLDDEPALVVATLKVLVKTAVFEPGFHQIEVSVHANDTLITIPMTLTIPSPD